MTDIDIDSLVDRGIEALEGDDDQEAARILDRAEALVGPDHPRVQHLAGVLAWAEGDLDRALGLLRRAAEADDADPQVALDLAECSFSQGGLEDAQDVIEEVLAREDLSDERADEARLLLAQVRLEDEDPDEAMAALDGISPERRSHPAFLSTKAAVLVADERFEEALAQLTQALEADGSDPDLHYQCAFVLAHAGREDEARASFVRTLHLDRERWDQAVAGQVPAQVSDAEVEDLRSRLEEAMEALPDPILKLVAEVPISVQPRATEAQVLGGVNPRDIVAFVGTPKREGQAADLTEIVVMRDLLLTEAEDEEELDGDLLYGLAEGIQLFFDRPDFVLAEG